MNPQKTLVTEFVLLFILLPLSFLLDYSVFVKVGLTLIGFGYVIYVLKRDSKLSFKLSNELEWSSFWKSVLTRFLIFVLVSVFYVWYVDSRLLFCVPMNKTGLWVSILFVYSLLSVWPQEIIYRTFFFTRYETLFSQRVVLVLVNAFVFSLAHLFFLNTLVLILTFVGGILFSLTYHKIRSTVMVSIEHALYGNWLFTVGMGDMLAFPGMDACV